jgi:hypothetical protein
MSKNGIGCIQTIAATEANFKIILSIFSIDFFISSVIKKSSNFFISYFQEFDKVISFVKNNTSYTSTSNNIHLNVVLPRQ